MSRQRGHGEQSDVVDSRQNASADLLSMLCALSASAAKWPFFRFELPRCLRMLRLQAPGIAVLGLAASICAQRSFPVSQAKSLSRVEPASSAMPEGMAAARWTENADAGGNAQTGEQKQLGVVYLPPRGNRRAPLFNTVAAATTSAPGDPGVIQEVLVLLIGFIVLGAGAAFVLHRVKTAKSDPTSRSSMAEMKRDGHGHNPVEDQQTLETLLFAVELGRASLEPESALAEDESGKLEGLNGSSAAAAAQKEDTVEPAVSSVAADAAQPFNDVPWWLAEAPARSDTSLTQSRIPKTSIAQCAQNRAQGDRAVQQEIESPPEESRQVRLPRLTELRGTLFSAGIKELDHTKHGDQHGSGQLNGEMARLEALLGARERGNSESAPQAADPETMRAFLAAPAESDEAAERNGGTEKLAAPPQLFLPKPAKPINGPIKVKAHQDVRQPIDKVEILPSRRGQYKRKG